jgi:hypothetical protein
MFKIADLQAARNAGIVSEEQYQQLVAFFQERQPGRDSPAAPRFDFTHVLWYGGALIVMVAMGLFATEAFTSMGGWALSITGVIYAAAFAVVGDNLWNRGGLRVPGGLMIAVAVSMIPMIIYGIQDALDLWNYALGQPGNYHSFFIYVNGSWLYMEIATVAAAAIAIRRYPFSFILLVGGIALWFMSMDLALWFTATPESFDDFETRRLVSLAFGAMLIVVSWAIDIRRRGEVDYALWLHIFGVMTFWGGLTFASGGTELEHFVYFLINVGLIGLGLFLDRRVYVGFGALGMAAYFGYLAYDVFKDVIAFSFALSAIGVAVIFLGLQLHKHNDAMATWLERTLPENLKWLKPGHAPRRVS